MKLYSVNDGKVVDVDDTQLMAALSSGVYTMPSPGPVAVSNPNGGTGTVPAANLLEAMQKGYMPLGEEALKARANEKRYGDSFGGELLSGILGFSRGATFGLSDVVHTEAAGLLGDPTVRETIKGLKDANPAASFAGEMGGALATSGISLAGRALQLTSSLGLAARTGLKAEGALARFLVSKGGQATERLAAYTAAGAVEGTVFGAGMGLSEAALGDTELLSQATLPLVMNGALVGMLGGAGGGFLVGGVMSAFGSKALQEGTRNAAEKIAHSAGLKQRFAEEAAPFEVIEQLGITRKAAMDEFGNAADVKTIVDDLMGIAPKDEAGNEMAVRGIFDVEPEFAKMARVETDAPVFRKLKDGETVAVWGERLTEAHRLHSERRASYFAYADSLLEGQPRDNPAVDGLLSSAKEITERIKKDVMPKFEGAAQDASFKLLRSTLQKFQTSPPSTFKELFDFSKAMEKAAAKSTDEEVRAVYTAIRSTTDDVMSKNLQRVVDMDWEERSLPQLSELARSERIVGQTSQLMNLISPGKLDEAILGGQFMSWASLGKVAQTMAQSASWSIAGGRGIGRMLGFAALSGGRQAIKPLGDVWSAGRRAAFYAKIQEHTLAMQQRIDNAIVAVRDGTPRSIGITGRLEALGGHSLRTPEGATEAVRTLQAASLDPNVFADNFATQTSELQEVAPNLAANMSLRAATIFKALAQSAPGTRGDMLQPHLDKKKLTPQEARQFKRRAQAMLDPLSQVELLGALNVSVEGMEIFRAMYPDLYKAVSEQLIEEISTSERKLSMQERAQVGLFLGLPGSVLGQPDSLAITAQVHKPVSAPAANQAPIDNPGGGSRRQKIDDSVKSAMSPTQALQSR